MNSKFELERNHFNTGIIVFGATTSCTIMTIDSKLFKILSYLHTSMQQNRNITDKQLEALVEEPDEALAKQVRQYTGCSKTKSGNVVYLNEAGLAALRNSL